MLFPFRTELVAENTIFGTQQALWKKDSEVSQFLKKIFTVALTSSGSQPLHCVGLIAYHPNDKRVE